VFIKKKQKKMAGLIVVTEHHKTPDIEKGILKK